MAVLAIPITFIGGASVYCPLLTLALAQASYRCIDWTADGFAGYEKLHSPVLLPAGGSCHGNSGPTSLKTAHQFERLNSAPGHTYSHVITASPATETAIRSVHY